MRISKRKSIRVEEKAKNGKRRKCHPHNSVIQEAISP
jgi:hypothetical protein